MQKFLLCIFLFISLFTNAQTSVYHTFPGVNAFWNFSESYYCWTGIPGSVSKSYSITIANDTVIGSQNYRKLFTPFLKTDSTGCSGAYITYNIYKGCIREDTSAKKVFYVQPLLSTEELLYDFNLQVGDTILGVLEAMGFEKDTVISIDSVLTAGTGGSWHKRWFINSGYNIYFIEGIGSTYGLIEYSPGNCPDAMERDILCMNGSSFIYPNITDCDAITSVNYIPEENSLHIFPNPSAGSFTIKFENTSFAEIILCDILGNNILQQSIHGQSTYVLQELNSGIYILSLVDKENRKINMKIVSNR